MNYQINEDESIRLARTYIRQGKEDWWGIALECTPPPTDEWVARFCEENSRCSRPLMVAARDRFILLGCRRDDLEAHYATLKRLIETTTMAVDAGKSSEARERRSLAELAIALKKLGD